MGLWEGIGSMGNGMTKEEFESKYAERSGITVEWLHEHGRFAVPCECGHSDCKGWQMSYKVSHKKSSINKVMFEAIARDVERNWGCGGLSHGLYYDYALEVAQRYFDSQNTISNIENFTSSIVGEK